MASIKSFIHNNVLTLKESTTAEVAARAMYEKHVGSVVVCTKQGQIVGIVTDRDLACEILGSEMSPDTPIGEIMNSQVAFVDESATLDHVIKIMESFCVRRVPVVKKISKNKEMCVGMITLDDLVTANAVTTDQLYRIVRSQITEAPPKKQKLPHSPERKIQTRDRFMKSMAQKTGLGKPFAEKLTRYFLGVLVRRLSPQAASHLTSELPRLLQDDLLDLTAGPDRKITGPSIVYDLEERFGFNEENARKVLRALWSGLQENLDRGLTSRLLVQLPGSIRVLLVEQPSPPSLEEEFPKVTFREETTERILTRE